MRLHGGVSPGKQLHADARRGLQNFPLAGTHQAGIVSRSLEQREDIGAVETRDAPQRSDRGAHLAALECAEKADRNAGGFCDLRQREATVSAQAAKPMSGNYSGFPW